MKIKSMATIALGAALAASVVFADVPVAISDDKPVYVNGVEIARDYINDTDGAIMLPVRALCETLGMNVQWDEAAEKVIIEKMPVYVTFSPYSDGYTFARTAPMQLGKAPILIEGTTYVPMNFVNEILQLELETKENGVYLTTEQKIAARKVNVTAKEEGAIAVYDVMQGEVIVNITEDTKITDKDGNALTIDAVNVNSLVEVEYGETMTMSLPPMTNAVTITVTGEEGFEVIEDTIAAVTDDESGKSITIGNKEVALEQTVLNVSDDIRIVAADGTDVEFSALKEGMKITAVVSIKSTRSIPAQKSVVIVRIAE